MRQTIQHVGFGARRFLLLIIAVACCFVASCWDPTGLPVCDTGDIQTQSVAFWNGSSWEAMGGIGLLGWVDAVAVDSVSGTVYCGGAFAIPGRLPGRNLAQWDDANRTWLPVSGGTNGMVRSVQYANGELYVAGDFSYCYDSNERSVANGPLAVWNGKNWKTIISNRRISIEDMLVRGTSIFFRGGNYDTGQNSLYEVNLLDFTVTIIGSTPDFIRCFEIVGDWIYVGGNFAQIENTGTPLAARWNIRSRQWEGIPGFGPVTGYVTGISSFVYIPGSSYLYVNGDFPLANGCSECNNSPAQIDLQSKTVSKLNYTMTSLHSFIPSARGGVAVGSNSSGQSGVFEFVQSSSAWVYLGTVCTSNELDRNTILSNFALYKGGFVFVGKFNYIVLP
jgi:hypothetical protein